MMPDDKILKLLKGLMSLVVLLVCVAATAIVYRLADPQLSALTNNPEDQSAELSTQQQPIVENGIHTKTGLIDDKGLSLIIANCTSCHSSKLITQNKMSRDRWLATIRWMQETQNLWQLGENEDAILDYLATNYAPEASGRRKNLSAIEWYELD